VTTTTAPPASPGTRPQPPPPRAPEPGQARARITTAIIIVAVLLLLGIGVIPPAAVVLSVPFIYLLARKPILRRLAVRNAVRRPREAALVILGALLGTAIITSSYVVGDTLTASIHRSVYTQLGPVDEVVLANGAQTGDAVRASVARAGVKGTDGILALTTLTAAVSTQGPDPKAEPRAQVIETDFGQARAFGHEPSATGISGPTPAAGQAVIGADLAATLGVKPGQPVTVYAYGTSTSFQVVRTVPRLGLAGLASFTGDNGSASPNLFVAPGTLAGLQRQGSAGAGTAPPLFVLAVSNVGNVTGGIKGSAAVSSQLQAAVRGLPAQVRTVKKQLTDNANTAGKQFTSFFQSFGYFSVFAGILLLINIFVMLAEERKKSLGMLRAVGLRRSSLVGSFALEGWIYAVSSSMVGAVAGIGIGRLVIVAASRIFNGGSRRNALSLQFSASSKSFQDGFLIGFVIAMLTVLFTSLYIARLNVIRAIRDLPEPPHDGRRLSVLIAGWSFAVLGGLLTTVGIASSSGIPALVGPAVLGFGLAMLLLGRVPTRPMASVISVLVLIWSVVCFSVIKRAFEKSGIGVFVAQGIVLTAYAVVLVTFNQQAIGSAIRVVGGGTRNMSLRLGLAYPLARRFRTGLILAMYAIVVFTLVLLITISKFFGGQLSDQIHKLGGNASVVVESNAAEPVPASAVARLPGVTSVAATAGVNAELRPGTKGDYNPYVAVGFDNSFIDHGSPPLHTLASQYATDDDAYRAVLADPTKIIVSRDFGSRGGGGPPGAAVSVDSTVQMRDSVTGAIRQLTIVGLVSEAAYNGRTDHVFIARSLADQFFGPRSSSSLLFVSTSARTDNDKLATTINGTYVANGADANSFRHLVTERNSGMQSFLTLIEGYVALGLLVGIAGLGVVMVRAVRERRRDVGVLRSLGFSRIAVRRAFVAESSFIALEGIGIGAVLAVITAWRLVTSSALGAGQGFTVPWVPVIGLSLGTLVVSLLATAVPAIQASRIRPAVALRIDD
jgi:putative ABC transport system permease protein